MKLKLGGNFQDPKICYPCFIRLPKEARKLPTGPKLAIFRWPLKSTFLSKMAFLRVIFELVSKEGKIVAVG
jgi:hypothetical protein